MAMSTPPSNPQRKANEGYSPMSNPQRKAYDVLSGLLSDPGLTYRHLVDVVSSGLVLQYKIEHNGGTSPNLLQAYGCVEKKNSLLVTICFTQDYPHLWRADAVFTDTNCVDSSGAVAHPYLDSWKCHESNLVSLVNELSKEFTNHPPLAIPHLNGVLTPDQAKLAKVLIENGGKQLYKSFGSLSTKHQKDIFQEITKTYPRHPDLATYIKNKQRGVEAFIKNVEDVASKYFKDSISCDSSSSGSGTHGSRQADQMSPLHSGPAVLSRVWLV